MKARDVIPLYEAKKLEVGAEEAFKYIPMILEGVRAQQEIEFLATNVKGAKGNTEQSWHSFTGYALEALVEHILLQEIQSLGLGIMKGSTLEGNSTPTGQLIKEQIQISFDKFDPVLPDSDLIIYIPQTFKVIAIISVKSSLRERIAQAGYWKLKLATQPATQHIKYYLVSIDKDKIFTIDPQKPDKQDSYVKQRIVAEADTDGVYILTLLEVKAGDKVKLFDQFITDLEHLIRGNGEI